MQEREEPFLIRLQKRKDLIPSWPTTGMLSPRAVYQNSILEYTLSLSLFFVDISIMNYCFCLLFINVYFINFLQQHSATIFSYHNGSFMEALTTLYPDIGINRSKFKNLPSMSLFLFFIIIS